MSLPDAREMRRRIAARGAACGLELDAASLELLTGHALAVLRADARLHLTAITDPSLHVERHVGESLEGAAMLDPAVEGALLDLGSGNGYPGLAVAAVRRGLRAYLVEASERKATFLRTLVASGPAGAVVLRRHVQRGADLDDLPPLSVVTARAVAAWERVLPRLAGRLAGSGQLLVWAGAGMETVSRRAVWQRYRLRERRSLPGRERSWIWRFVPA